MAVDDIVRTIRNIRTFDPETLKIRPDGIPRGSLGSIIVEDNADRFISVQFEFIREGLKKITRIVGVFGEDAVDTIANSLEFISVQPAPELIAEIREASTVGLESKRDLALQAAEPPPLFTVADPLRLGTFALPNGLTPSTEFPNAFTLAPNTALPSGFEFINGSRNDDQVRRIELVPPDAQVSTNRPFILDPTVSGGRFGAPGQPFPAQPAAGVFGNLLINIPVTQGRERFEVTEAASAAGLEFALGRIRSLGLDIPDERIPELAERVDRAISFNLILGDRSLQLFINPLPPTELGLRI